MRSPFRLTTEFALAGVGPTGKVRMGFCGHNGRNWTEGSATVIDALNAVNGKILREDIGWGRVEPTLGNLAYPGVDAGLTRLNTTYNLCLQNDIEPLGILDYGNSNYGDAGLPLTEVELNAFANYVSYTVGATMGQINQFEIWNEWNIGLGANVAESGAGVLAYLNPVGYYNLTVVSYAAAKAANPSAFIWGGVLSDPMELSPNNNVLGYAKHKNEWFEQYTSIPGWSDHMDGFSFHHYMNFANPERWFWQVRGIVQRAREKAGKMDLPVMVSETGWYNGTDPGSVSEQVAADYYSRWPFLARCTGVSKVAFYDLRNDGTSAEKEDNFGVFSSTYVPKQAATVLADVLPAVHASSNAAYYTNGNQHVVVLDVDQACAAWVTEFDGVLQLKLSAKSAGIATLKVAGGESTTVPFSAGDSTIDVPIGVRSTIVTTNNGSSISI